MLTSRFPGEVSGADLPTLTNPAGAGDMASGKQAIGQDGMVVTGNVPTPNSVTLEDGTVEVGVSIGGGGVFLATGTMATDNLLRAGKTVQVSVAASEFGNAEAADVAAGKTFTSSAGLAVTGTGTMAEIITRSAVVTITPDEVIMGGVDKAITYTCPDGYIPFSISTSNPNATVGITSVELISPVQGRWKLTYNMTWAGDTMEEVASTISLIKVWGGEAT